mgnify:CR=1 FL=1
MLAHNLATDSPLLWNKSAEQFQKMARTSKTVHRE